MSDDKEAPKGIESIRYDDWLNTLTGLGTFRDKAAGSKFSSSCVSKSELECLYREDGIAARIVETAPEIAIRAGWELFIKDEAQAEDMTDEEKDEILKSANKILEEFNVTKNLLEAWKWSELFGGGAIYVVANDSNAQDQPLNLTNLRRIDELRVFDCRDLKIHSCYEDPSSPKFGEPEKYVYDPNDTYKEGTSLSEAIIHETRLIRFDGISCTPRTRVELNYWGESRLSRSYNALKRYRTAIAAASHLIEISNQGVFKVKGLTNLMLSNNEGAVSRRLAPVDIARGIRRSIAVDAEMEEFEVVNANLGGVEQVINTLQCDLSSSCRIPVFGKTPGGLNATTEEEKKVFYDYIDSERRNYFLPNLKKLVEILIGDRFGVNLGPLIRTSDMEEADLRLKTAQLDQLYVNMGVYTSEDIRKGRFGENGWSFDLIVEDAPEELEESINFGQEASEEPQETTSKAGPELESDFRDEEELQTL